MTDPNTNSTYQGKSRIPNRRFDVIKMKKENTDVSDKIKYAPPPAEPEKKEQSIEGE